MKTDLWMPMLGELMWEPYQRPSQPQVLVATPGPATLREYNAARMREDLNTLTETFVELYCEANPNMAQRMGHA